jgi:hypothetical protein
MVPSQSSIIAALTTNRSKGGLTGRTMIPPCDDRSRL